MYYNSFLFCLFCSIIGSKEMIWIIDEIFVTSYRVAGSSVEYYGDTHCVIYEDGTVHWTPPTQFLALCDLDLRLWPFDTQNCHLRLGSWVYFGDQIDLQFFDSSTRTVAGDFDVSDNRIEMRISKISKKFICSPIIIISIQSGNWLIWHTHDIPKSIMTPIWSL